jgi:hypothetical protein
MSVLGRGEEEHAWCAPILNAASCGDEELVKSKRPIGGWRDGVLVAG